ncbi:MAG: DUF2147 domain-containing protein, partial [Pseudomonadota bacterium]
MARIAIATAVFFAIAAGTDPVGGTTDPAFGFWQTANGGAIIEIAACEEGACGQMVWMSRPNEDDGSPRRDAEGRPLCGLTLVSGLKRAGAGVWQEGEIVDPRSGQRYSAEIAVLDEAHLEVRGYLLTSLFGSSQVW